MNDEQPTDEYSHILDEDDQLIEFSTVDENAQLALEMAQQARRSLHIFSYDLDARIYDNPGFVDAVAHLARSSKFAHVHILVRDSNQAVKHGHRLVQLAHRLGSYVKIHNPGPDHEDFNESLLIADERGYIRRLFADRHEGSACFKAPIEAREYERVFHEMWERSSPDPQLRRLGL